jgi:hypothetical protein
MLDVPAILPIATYRTFFPPFSPKFFRQINLPATFSKIPSPPFSPVCRSSSVSLLRANGSLVVVRRGDNRSPRDGDDARNRRTKTRGSEPSHHRLRQIVIASESKSNHGEFVSLRVGDGRQ